MHAKLRLVLGIFIITIGVIFMLDVLTIIDAGKVFHDFWPLLLIIFGVFAISDKNSSTFVGSILILIGVYFQLDLLDLELLDHIDISEFIIPVIIIIIGVRILIKPKQIG